MKLIIQGQGEITLSQSDFVASGGEGAIYAKGATAFKVYSDANKLLPLGKITELAAIGDPHIIKPERVLLDPTSASPIGYTMPFIRDTLPLCQLFTRAFREREGLDPARMLGLVDGLRALIQHVHDVGILLVDLNEMNFLVDRGFTTVYGIDVDSYQTPNYPATALMPSVRDWQSASFHPGSDWFSFACIAFQMFVGIHPYKGRHPSVTGLEERMKANLSVFDPAVSVPKAVYPLDVIPPAWRSWLRAVLQDGQRCAPPTALGSAPASVAARSISGSAELDITEIAAFPGAVLGYVEHGGQAVAWTTAGIFWNGRRIAEPRALGGVGFSPRENRPILAWIEGGLLRLLDATTGRDVPVSLRADALMICGPRLYLRSGDRIFELLLTELGDGVLASARLAAQVLEHATHLFDGVAIQSLLGATYISLFPRPNTTYQVRVPELDGCTVLEARYDQRVLMALVTRKGRYHRITFHFSAEHDRYVTRPMAWDVTPAGLNFVTLDNLVCVQVNEDEDLEISAVGNDNVRVVRSAQIGNDLRLVKHGGRVAFVRGDRVFAIRMK